MKGQQIYTVIQAVHCDRKSGKSVGVVTDGTYSPALFRRYTDCYRASATKVARGRLEAVGKLQLFRIKQLKASIRSPEGYH